MIGQTISHYKILEKLGEGGMGVVYKAEDTKLKRNVAIKFLPRQIAFSEEERERFKVEAQAAAALNHPNIATIHSIEEVDNELFIVMEYIEGRELRDIVGAHGCASLPTETIVDYATQIASGLQAAHDKGVTHRDIKSANIMVTDKGQVKIMDFGLAKVAGGARLTKDQSTLGTAAYMSPEQARGEPVDHRTDIWSLGVVLYELLIGQLPFRGDYEQAVVYSILNEKPTAISELRDGVPPELEAIVTKSLSKDVDERYRRAGDLSAELSSVLSKWEVGGTGKAQAHTPALRWAAWFSLASIGVLALVYSLMIALGLPDWIFPTAVVLLFVGLPVILLTGQAERRRAVELTTNRPNRFYDWLTWRKAVIGGVLAFAVLGVISGMRLLGVGPFATLLSAGMLNERDLLIIADFENRTADSTLGLAVTEAFRVDLSQSQTIQTIEKSTISTTLELMKREPGSAIDLSTAREIAERQGAKAIVAGEINAVGQGFVLSARLLSSPDAKELAALRETAANDGEIIGAIDRLSKNLRERIGESLKGIRASARLDQVTTASLEALRLYMRGLEADERAEWPRAISLLQAATEIDTTFAMAYRKLAVLHATRGEITDNIKAGTRAYQLRDRLTPKERDLATANYFANVEFNPTKAIEAYRSVIEQEPDNTLALNNLSARLNAMRRFEEAERLALRAVQLDSSYLAYNVNVVEARVGQGRFAEAYALIERFSKLNPKHPFGKLGISMLNMIEGNYETSKLISRQYVEGEKRALSSFAHYLLAKNERYLGKLTSSEAHIRKGEEARSREGRSPSLNAALDAAWIDLRFRGNVAEAVQTIESGLERLPLSGIAPLDRPHLELAYFYAIAGHLDRARAMLQEYEREIPEGRRRKDAFRYAPYGWIALQEGRSQDAVAAFRKWYQESSCLNCSFYQQGLAFEQAGEIDSALVAYERSVLWESFAPDDQDDSTVRPFAYLRLGELYAQSGKIDKAIEFYTRFVELWKDCDPELRPKVEAAQKALTRLLQEKAKEPAQKQTQVQEQD